MTDRDKKKQAPIIRSSFSKVNPKELLNIDGFDLERVLEMDPEFLNTEGEHEHDDFDSFSVALPELAAPDALLARLEQVAEQHDVLRIKGFLAVADKPMRLVVQGVGRRFRQHYDRPWKPGEARRGTLVVIGETGMDRAAIEAALTG